MNPNRVLCRISVSHDDSRRRWMLHIGQYTYIHYTVYMSIIHTRIILIPAQNVPQQFIPVTTTRYPREMACRICICKINSSVVDPDPNWIRFQDLCGSVSIFRVRTRIRIHTGKFRLKYKEIGVKSKT